MSKEIAKAWWFASSSSDKNHETLLYTDGSTSCQCMGWCRRVAADGSRSCKHTRFVDSGMADSECVKSVDYKNPNAKSKSAQEVQPKHISKKKETFEKSDKVKRKIQW